MYLHCLVKWLWNNWRLEDFNLEWEVPTRELGALKHLKGHHGRLSDVSLPHLRFQHAEIWWVVPEEHPRAGMTNRTSPKRHLSERGSSYCYAGEHVGCRERALTREHQRAHLEHFKYFQHGHIGTSCSASQTSNYFKGQPTAQAAQR